MTALRRSAKTADLTTADEYSHEIDPKAWIAHHILKAEKAGVPHAVCVTVDPALAAALLDLNPEHWNRKISNKLVARWEEAIREDAWDLNGETVIVAKTSELNNGQHRLSGCIRAGKPFPTFIVFGIERDTRGSLDQGKRRTLGDHLTMNGFSNVNIRAAAASVVVGVLNRSINTLSQGQVTPNQVLATQQDHPKILEGEHLAKRMNAAFKTSVSTFTGLHYLFSRRSEDGAAMFFQYMLYGTGSTAKDDPINRLQTYLREANGRGIRRHRSQVVAITIKAWNFFWRGERTGPLFWRVAGQDEPLPMIDDWTEFSEAMLKKALKK